MAKAIIKNGWAYCPIHNTKLCRVGENVQAKDIKLWCKQCKAEVELNI